MIIYVVDAGQRITAVPSTTGQINVMCVIEWSSVDGSQFGMVERIIVPIPRNSANWSNAFQSAVEAWATAQGHIIDKLVMCDYSIRQETYA